MPAWVNSDHLTLLGLVALLGVGLSYWWARSNPMGLYAAMVCLAVNWFGDSLDGTLARVRNRLRPRYGFYEYCRAGLRNSRGPALTSASRSSNPDRSGLGRRFPSLGRSRIEQVAKSANRLDHHGIGRIGLHFLAQP